MTAATLTEPVSVRAFLFGEGHDDEQHPEDSGQALAQVLDWEGRGGALQSLSRSGRAAVSSELDGAARGLLDELDLGGLLVAGWCKYAALRAAAERTIAAPGSTEVVDLATHHVTSTRSFTVELIVDGQCAATVHFKLSVEFAVKELAATVCQGYLAGFRSGGCEATGALRVEGRDWVARHAQLELPLVISLGDGIPLLGHETGSARPPGPAQHP